MRYTSIGYSRTPDGFVNIVMQANDGSFHDMLAHSTVCGLTEAEKDALLTWMGSSFEMEKASRFPKGTRVRKIKGASWQGRVVGYYDTALTPDGVAVESEREPGSVQIYPVSALEEC